VFTHTPLHERRSSVRMNGWWNRSIEENEVNALVFSEMGHLYGLGSGLYGIFMDDGTRGKIIDLPAVAVAGSWEQHVC